MKQKQFYQLDSNLFMVYSTDRYVVLAQQTPNRILYLTCVCVCVPCVCPTYKT